ncbi:MULTISPECIES: hypothetical protein [Streptomyces]|uniref:hypothetical protein n=1 Tax=Streptomyces TaxID=1883 RepID=UPI0004CD112F|nr:MULTISPECIES: hypothetical protein [Streptomyces]
MDWPDVETLLIGWLRERGYDARDELDNDLLDELPVVQVEALPAGDDDGLRLERALLDIDVYAADSVAASAMSGQIRHLLLNELRGSKLPEAVVGKVATVARPARRPYENTALRRYGATYEIYLHPVS